MRLDFLVLMLFLMLISPQAFAQKEAANWFFGNTAGLNFNSGFPVPQFGQLQTIEGSATISDRNGNLLFYTDGSIVFDRKHNPMPNGNGLMGNVSSTQSAIIIPKPASPGIYYIFTVDKPDYTRVSQDPIDGVNYSVVDMSLNGGFGDLVPSQKNIHLITYNPASALEREYKSSEKISAVLHGDGSSYWVVTHHGDKFYSFKVTSNGVETIPVISTSTNIPPVINEEGVNITAIGYMKISPDGKKLAAAFSSTRLGSDRTGHKNSGKVFLYDFNDLTGVVSNAQLLLFDSYPYGVEFSPKTTKLYVTSNIYDQQDVMLRSELYQFNLEEGNILNSRTTINTSNNVAGALQLAMDGRIYRAGYPVFSQYFTKMSVINNPEATGNVSYNHNSIDISPGGVRLGLPPFIQSLFLNNFDFENLCFGDATRFFITTDEPYTSVLWDFGDGNTSTSPEAFHTYSSPGTYVVSFTRFLNGEAFEPSRKELTIVEVSDILKTFELVQCDTDENPSDGIATFNLQQAKDEITLGNTNTQIFFYEDKNSALEDELNQNAINDVYTNHTRNQVVFAKVIGFNSICFDISEVTLNTKDSVLLNPDPAQGCDLGNGKAEFNMETIRNKIISQLSLPPDIDISFHTTHSNAEVGIQPLPEIYESGPGKVFIKAVHDGICYGAGELDLEITTFPDLPEMMELNSCSNKMPLTLGSELNFPNIENFDFLWNTGETSREIQVQVGGTYFVEITNPQIGCGKTVQYFVEEYPSPVIMDVEIKSNGENNEVTIIASLTEGTLYALDNIDGPYQEDPVFRNITPGPHMVYVKNNQGCEIKQREILLFGFPKFFTPNNDGYNDRWKPIDIPNEDFRIENIYIFDRYGKLLKQLDPNAQGWDGTFNNRPMPVNDYWFHVILINGREFKGHFTLTR